jgi:hypothetical protein
MIRTSRQLKALVRNLSKGDSTRAQIIIRNYVMERRKKCLIFANVPLNACRFSHTGSFLYFSSLFFQSISA